MLLLDEPLGALDLKLRRQLQLELKRIQAEVGITFVYVTHDQEEALTMSDRIAVMHAGKVEQLGTPEELYERPTTRFVADFIGSTNLLRGRIEADGRVRLTSGEIARVAHDGLATGTEVEISVRPEAIALVPAAAAGAIRATVEQAAYLGTTISYQVRTAGGLGPDRALTQGRDPTPGRQRRRHQLAPVRGTGPRRRPGPARRRSRMSERPDDQRLRRRARPGPLHGRAADDAVGCCSSGSARSVRSSHWRRSSPPARARRRRPHRRGRRRAASAPPPAAPSGDRGPDRDPRADAGPLARERAVRLQLARLHRRGRHPVRFEEKYRIKVKYELFPDASTQTTRSSAATARGGYDISFPTSVDIPPLPDGGIVRSSTSR